MNLLRNRKRKTGKKKMTHEVRGVLGTLKTRGDKRTGTVYVKRVRSK
jgi:hypothetical protein